MFVCSMVKYLLFKKKSEPFITYQIADNKLLLGQQYSKCGLENPWVPGALSEVHEVKLFS